MKAAVAITLIVAGAMVALAPVVSDYLYQGRLVEMAAAGETGLEITRSRLGPEYSIGCYTLGALMVLVGIAGSGLFRSITSSE
jgi:hypothetical protein